MPRFEESLEWWKKPEGREWGTELGAFLSGLVRPTALFACNDTTGLRATELAGRLGLAVPRELAILGVDNEDILCELASPSLSSVMLDIEAIGYRAAAALDAVLEGGAEGGGPPAGSRISVPPKEVAERESTRIFSCPDELVARAATFIRARAHEGIDVSDVLAVVPASRRSLETRFRAAMGRSLHEEIVLSRLVMAKRLLRETDYTMDRVAADSGFGGLQRFHETFRAAEGLSPGQWRKRMAEGAPREAEGRDAARSPAPPDFTVRYPGYGIYSRFARLRSASIPPGA
jgi:LacI family transcriptional regulator